MSTAALADTERLEKLDRAIEAMVRNFEKLLHASKMQANADGPVGHAGSTKPAADERVPGQFLEVLAEKMVSQCNEAIVQIRVLKHTALLSDFKLQNRALKETHTRMGEATRQTSHQIRHLKREILQMLQLLEDDYYTGSVRSEGTDEDHGIDASLRELYHLAVSAAPTD